MATLSREKEVSIDVAIQLLEALIDKNRPTMLWGAPGIGKSAIVHQIGERRDWKVIEFRTNIREPVDVRGVPMPDPVTGTTRWFVPDELPREDRDGKHGILFIDEINTGSPQMMAVMFGLVLDRRVGEYTLPKGWVIVAAGNRVSDRASAQRMPTALRNRFAHLFIAPNVEAWVKWATVSDVAPELVAFVRLRRDDVLHVMPKGDENAFPTPRSLVASGDFVDSPRAIRLQLFAANIGDAFAAELDGFIELYRSLGSLDDIVANPDSHKLPSNASERYAVCTGLGRIATKKNFNAIMVYAKRLPRESAALVMHDATLRDKSLCNTKAYTEWAVDNQDLILQAA